MNPKVINYINGLMQNCGISIMYGKYYSLTLSLPICWTYNFVVQLTIKTYLW